MHIRARTLLSRSMHITVCILREYQTTRVRTSSQSTSASSCSYTLEQSQHVVDLQRLTNRVAIFVLLASIRAQSKHTTTSTCLYAYSMHNIMQCIHTSYSISSMHSSHWARGLLTNSPLFPLLLEVVCILQYLFGACILTKSARKSLCLFEGVF